MSTVHSHPGEPDRHAGDSAAVGEDLAALIGRLLREVDRTQKDLSDESGINYTRLNMWVNRKRGTSRVDPDDLRRLASTFKGWGAVVTVRQLFEAAGRPVPGPSDAEREGRLLRLYRQLPEDRQRDVLKYVDAQLRIARAL